MPSKTPLILRRPQGGRLEGRMIVLQRAFQFPHNLFGAVVTVAVGTTRCVGQC